MIVEQSCKSFLLFFGFIAFQPCLVQPWFLPMRSETMITDELINECNVLERNALDGSAPPSWIRSIAFSVFLLVISRLMTDEREVALHQGAIDVVRGISH